MKRPSVTPELPLHIQNKWRALQRQDSTEAVNQCRLAQEPLQGFFLLNKDNVVHNNLICQEDVEP